MSKTRTVIRSAWPRPCLVTVVKSMVAGMFQVPLDALESEKRGTAQVARARQAAMYLCNVALEIDLGRVGQAFGRDRTTAAHACNRIEDLREDPHYERVLDLLETVFRDMKGFWRCPSCPACKPKE